MPVKRVPHRDAVDARILRGAQEDVKCQKQKAERREAGGHELHEFTRITATGVLSTDDRMDTDHAVDEQEATKATENQGVARESRERTQMNLE